MADIKIYGRLWNSTTDGEIASAEQVKYSSWSGKESYPSAVFVNDILDALWASRNALADTLSSDYQEKLVSGTNIKTVNGTSILGSGNITIDLTLYKVVTSLPTSGIDTNKIYLLAGSTTGTQNVYTEYIYVSGAWEKIGEYKADIDLTPYAKTTDVDAALALKADADDVYTKDEIDKQVATLEDTLTSLVTTGTVSNALAVVTPSTSATSTGVTLTLAEKTINGTTSNSLSASLPVASSSAAGILTASDYSKLAGITSGAEPNQYAFSIVQVGSTMVLANQATDTLVIQPGTNMQISGNDTGNIITIATKATADSAIDSDFIDETCV